MLFCHWLLLCFLLLFPFFMLLISEDSPIFVVELALLPGLAMTLFPELAWLSVLLLVNVGAVVLPALSVLKVPTNFGLIHL